MKCHFIKKLFRQKESLFASLSNLEKLVYFERYVFQDNRNISVIDLLK